MVVILPDTVIGQIIKLCLLQKYNRPKPSENLALRLQENSCEMRFLSVMYTYLLQHQVLWKCTVLWELEGKWGTAEYICFRTAKSQGEVKSVLGPGRWDSPASLRCDGSSFWAVYLHTWGRDFRDHLHISNPGTRVMEKQYIWISNQKAQGFRELGIFFYFFFSLSPADLK